MSGMANWRGFDGNPSDQFRNPSSKPDFPGIRASSTHFAPQAPASQVLAHSGDDP